MAGLDLTYREIWKQSGAQIRGEADKRTGGGGVSVSEQECRSRNTEEEVELRKEEESFELWLPAVEINSS